jgi:multisubunit Na+/H+ antiporter MnhC subunit
MSVFPFLVVAWIVAVGLYGMITSRDLIHQVVCLIVVQSSTYVLLLGVGYVTGGVAPYFFDISPHAKAVDLRPRDIPASSMPQTSTSPLEGSSKLPAMVSSVDLPEPDGPITATISPARTDRSTPASAHTAEVPCS